VSTATIVGVVVLHLPPVAGSVYVAHEPWQRSDGPTIVGGSEFTTTSLVTKHPLGRVYETIVKPGATPHIRPVIGSMVATDVLLLFHEPPGVGSLIGMHELTQIFDGPVIAEGLG
jgi:hypothetical protein